VPEIRVGLGYDLHAFAPGRPLMLGGVRVEHDRGLAGHSDADVLLHAVVDALLGAAALGDIGDWFPPDDTRYTDAPSSLFVTTVAAELGRRGWRVVNLDATVIAQEPRLAAYRARIRGSLAEALRVEVERISVKATTPDHLGSLGRAEGIAAQAVVLLESPDQSTSRPGGAASP
jgi:2-C-methyl-D-erythritol 2,4-cyclodiphosphate synthase